jgi:hypothetical protein
LADAGFESIGELSFCADMIAGSTGVSDWGEGEDTEASKAVAGLEAGAGAGEAGLLRGVALFPSTNIVFI